MSATFVLYDADQLGAPPGPDCLDARSAGLRLSGASDWSVRLRRLRGGLSDGVELLDLCSGPLTVRLLPTRGMGIWQARVGDVVAGWHAPVQRPVHPRQVELGSRNGLGWLDGFNELLCRCGLAFNGPPGIDPGARSPIESQLTLHGKIANLPAHRLVVEIDSDGPGRISVTGVVDECTLFGPQLRLTSTATVTAGETRIQIRDQIENLASTPTELELLYHINLGPPFLDAGAQALVPAAAIAPRDPRAAEGIDSFERFLGPTPGYAEQAYFFRPLADASGRAETMLRNGAGDLGFGVAFDLAALPWFTLWKCTQPLEDGYVAGLEPGTNLPNFKSFERDQGRVIALAPGAAHTTELELALFTSRAAVAAQAARIAALQASSPATIHRRPTLPYSRPE